MSRYKLLAVALGMFLMFGSTALAGSGFKVKPGEFVGTAEQCGGTAGVDTVDGSWVAKEGLPDGGKSNHALYLQKFGSTANCAAGGANVDGVEGITLTELSFDYRNDGHCGAGSPRFNVYTEVGTFFFGCAHGDQTPAPDAPLTWTRVRFTDADAFPADGVTVFPGFDNVTITGIDIIFDEGEDAGEGFVYLDNIDINSTLIGKPGNV